MTLVEKLERAAKKYDRRVKLSLSDGYSGESADLRELLEEAAKAIRQPTMVIADSQDW